MEIKVYNWEYFERGKTRYIVFALLILTVIVISILSKNYIWWVLVFLVSWWYIFYATKSNELVDMRIWKKALQIGKIVYAWDSLRWFVLEYHTKKEKVQNIVILEQNNIPRIYTIKSPDSKSFQSFINELVEYIPMLEKYDQSTFDKFIRKIKL